MNRGQTREARAILDALSARFVALPPSSVRAASLSDGHAGLALVNAALDGEFPRRGHAQAAERALARCMEEVSTKALPASFHAGLAGIAWVAELLTGDPAAPRGDDVNADVDAALEQVVDASRGPWKEPYDLIGGLVGIGVYALERLPRASGRRLVARVVARLEETARRRRPGIAWRTSPAWVPPPWRESPHPPWNLGVAHGVPGVVAFLGRVVAAGAGATTRAKARALLEPAVAWLLSQELPPASPGRFARATGPGLRPTATRLAWCYGDAGVAATLLVAARGARRPDWEDAAVRIALQAATRPAETSGIVDAGLCHGAAGVAHIFHRMFLATGERRLAEAARGWFARALAMRRARGGFAGFAACVQDPDGTVRWRPDPGFLTGAAGLALALHTATTGADAAWDRALLVS